MAKTKYNEDFPILAEGYARQGLIDEQIAKNLGISHDTFYRYMKEYPEFAEAIKRGKRPVDFEVENELLKLALGYKAVDRVIEYYPPQDGQPPQIKSIKEIKKQIAGDIKAITVWLYNRNPERWSNRKFIDVRSTIEQQVQNMTPEERAKKLSEIRAKIEKSNKRMNKVKMIEAKKNVEDAVIISEKKNDE